MKPLIMPKKMSNFRKAEKVLKSCISKEDRLITSLKRSILSILANRSGPGTPAVLTVNLITLRLSTFQQRLRSSTREKSISHAWSAIYYKTIT